MREDTGDNTEDIKGGGGLEGLGLTCWTDVLGRLDGWTGGEEKTRD